MSGINKDLSVTGGPKIDVKRVDQAKVDLSKRTASADRKGDTAKSAMDEISNAGNPRKQMRGQQTGRGYRETGTAFHSTSNSPDSDEGN